MSLQSPEKITDIDAAFSVQYGVYFIDTDEIVAGLDTEEDARECVEDLVAGGTVYLHETRIVRIKVDIEEVKA